MDRKRLGSFVLGGLTGLIAGVLLAPKSGRETRGKIANRAGEARQHGSESLYDARERISERISSAREKAPTPGAHVAGGRSEGTTPEADHDVSHQRPVLRDVSKDTDGEPPIPPTDSSDRSEILRKKVRETREKLRDLTSEDPKEKSVGKSEETDREQV